MSPLPGIHHKLPANPRPLTRPVAGIKKVHAVLLSHLDIGYTGPPDKVEIQHKDNLDAAIALCRKDPEFRYVIEATYILRHWLNRTDDPGRVRELVELIKAGRMEVGGIHTTMHSAISGPEDLNMMVYEARRLSEELGIEIVTGIQNDVPGYPWAFPQILTKSGLRYLFVGINTLLSGGFELPFSDLPCYWEGVDGSRILMFVQTGYMHAVFPWDYMEILRFGGKYEDAAPHIRRHIADLEAGGYPYDEFLLMMCPDDNFGPMDQLSFVEGLRRWNAEEGTPEFVLSTPRRYFESLESRYGSDFPVCRGDWPASFEWDLVKARGPMSTTGYRRTQTNLPTAEKLLEADSLLHGRDYPRHDVAQAYEGLMLYGEHSAVEGHGAGARFTRRELFWGNQEHHAYASRAFHRTESLLERGREAMAAWVSDDANKIVVYNQSNWPRTDTVRVARTIHRYDFFGQHSFSHLRDMETGETVPCDNIEMSELGGDGIGPDVWPCVTFLAREVPPLGFRVYEAVRLPIPEHDPDVQIPTPPSRREDRCIENEAYRVTVDPATGDILSIFDKRLRREVVGEGRAFNHIDCTTPLEAKGVTVERVDGVTFQRLEIRRPGSWFPETHIRLTDGVDQVEVTNVIDRKAWKAAYPKGDICGMHLRLPLNLRGKASRLVVSGPVGFRQVPEDLLPDAPSNTLPSSAFLSADDGEMCVMIASPIDYLFLPGDRNDEKLLDLSTQIFWQMFETVARSCGKVILPYTEPEEEGRFVRRYAVTSRRGGFNARAAQRFGWGFRGEMIGHYVRPGKKQHIGDFADPAKSLVMIDDEDVALQAMRRSLFAKGNYGILRLQEMTGRKARRVRLDFAPELGIGWVASADMVERKGRKLRPDKAGGYRVRIGPFETVTLAFGKV